MEGNSYVHDSRNRNNRPLSIQKFEYICVKHRKYITMSGYQRTLTFYYDEL